MKLKSIIDSHIHSRFSPDSSLYLEEGVLSAIDKGLGGIIFTDHFDLAYPNTKFNFTFDFSERLEKIVGLSETYSSRIKILEGLEVGFQPSIVNEITNLLKSHVFDFIICSIHVVDKYDFWTQSFFNRKTKNDAYRRYLEAIYESISLFSDFDVAGHIGYVCRYAPYEDKSLGYNDYSDLLDAIFKKLIADNKGIEVNTAGLRYGLGFTHPSIDSLKRYRALGGEIVTLASDSHDVKSVGAGFDVAIELLRDAGFKYVTHFEKRKPIFRKL